MIDGADKQMSFSRQCELLWMHRSVYYYNPKGSSQADLRIMELMDRMYDEDPTRGTRRYRRDLKLVGILISRDKVRRLMKITRIKTIYCKPRTTVVDPTAYKYPYLLRGLDIVRAKQVW
jgi:putative transposase